MDATQHADSTHSALYCALADVYVPAIPKPSEPAQQHPHSDPAQCPNSPLMHAFIGGACCSRTEQNV